MCLLGPLGNFNVAERESAHAAERCCAVCADGAPAEIDSLEIRARFHRTGERRRAGGPDLVPGKAQRTQAAA
jgi:hypothetical protein